MIRGMRCLPLVLLLLAGACDTKAFTLPLPLGGSLVIPLGRIDACTWAHERRHQEQIARMGSTRFLAAIAAEHLDEGPRCGPLEYEAYEAEHGCRSDMSALTPAERRVVIGCGP